MNRSAYKLLSAKISQMGFAILHQLSMGAAFLVCKNFFHTRAVKKLPRVGRLKNFMPRDKRSFLRELGSNRFESLPEIMLLCEMKLNLGT